MKCSPPTASRRAGIADCWRHGRRRPNAAAPRPTSPASPQRFSRKAPAPPPHCRRAAWRHPECREGRGRPRTMAASDKGLAVTRARPMAANTISTMTRRQHRPPAEVVIVAERTNQQPGCHQAHGRENRECHDDWPAVVGKRSISEQINNRGNAGQIDGREFDDQEDQPVGRQVGEAAADQDFIGLNRDRRAVAAHRRAAKLIV